MLNKKCKYYPCHEGLEDCSQCFCILYPCEIEELGRYVAKDRYGPEVWDCSNCTIMHKKENIDLIKKMITDLVRYKLIKK